MKGLPIHERRAKAQARRKADPSLTIAQLATEFGVSPETMAKDLNPSMRERELEARRSTNRNFHRVTGPRG